MLKAPFKQTFLLAVLLVFALSAVAYDSGKTGVPPFNGFIPAGVFDQGIVFSPVIQGTFYDGDQFTVTLPAGYTFAKDVVLQQSPTDPYPAVSIFYIMSGGHVGDSSVTIGYMYYLYNYTGCLIIADDYGDDGLTLAVDSPVDGDIMVSFSGDYSGSLVVGYYGDEEDYPFIKYGYEWYLPYVADNDYYRANLGIVNTEEDQASVSIEFWNCDGSEYYSMVDTVEGKQYKPYANIIRTITGASQGTVVYKAGMLRVTSDKTAQIIGGLVDVMSNDPSVVGGMWKGQQFTYTPIMISTATDNDKSTMIKGASAWTTHMTLSNFNDYPVSVLLRALDTKYGTGITVADKKITIAAHSQETTFDLFDYMGLDTDTYGYFGQLDVRAFNGPVAGFFHQYNGNFGGVYPNVIRYPNTNDFPGAWSEDFNYGVGNNWILNPTYFEYVIMRLRAHQVGSAGLVTAYYDEDYENFVYRTDLVIPAQRGYSAGIVWRFNESTDSGYTLLLSNGYYSVWKGSLGMPVNLVGWTDIYPIYDYDTGRTRIAVLGMGDTFYIFINGLHVFSFVDDDHASGKVGFTYYDSSTDIYPAYLDNAELATWEEGQQVPMPKGGIFHVEPEEGVPFPGKAPERD